jgi:hypothetical protein
LCTAATARTLRLNIKRFDERDTVVSASLFECRSNLVGNASLLPNSLCRVVPDQVRVVRARESLLAFENASRRELFCVYPRSTDGPNPV